jgi:hypothetical protein
MYMKVRSVGVGRVWDCILCICVRRVGTGRVRSQKCHLWCHTHLDTSVSRSWSHYQFEVWEPMHLYVYVSHLITIVLWYIIFLEIHLLRLPVSLRISNTKCVVTNTFSTSSLQTARCLGRHIPYWPTGEQRHQQIVLGRFLVVFRVCVWQ